MSRKQKREPVATPELLHCICCGCTDSAPCLGGCWWTAVDEISNSGAGLCSRCAAIPLAELEQRLQLTPATGIFVPAVHR